MSNRAALHKLVDELPESALLRAERVLVVLRQAADPLALALSDAPVDDEPETREKRAAAEAARHDPSRSLTTQELKRELGLP